MMKEFPVPIVAMGPGSQPEEEALQYMPLPSGMTTFALPFCNDEADPVLMTAACGVIEQLRDKMMAAPLGSAEPPVIDLLGMNPDVVRVLNQTLGEGEVSISVRGAGPHRIQETVFAGVWRVQEYAADGRLIGDTITACAIPPMTTQMEQDGVVPDCRIPQDSAGIMNAPAVLTEINCKSGAYRAGDGAHVINLTLLPMTPEDLNCLALTLGTGAVTILSRGYGNCRITSTRWPHVWWVQYFNSMDALILNTIEISDVPEVAQASAEDYADSIERLGEWLQVMRAPEELDA